MNKIVKFIGSLKLAGIILIVLSVVLAFATFIENDFGALHAKNVVYNTWWFEVLLFILAINLIGSIFYLKLFSGKKYSRIVFHIAFVFILAGGFFTKHLPWKE